MSSSSTLPSEQQETGVVGDCAKTRRGTVLRLKCLYFFQAVGPSSWGRYSSAYYDGVGLTPAQVGYITGSMPFMKAICMPLWGMVADRTSKKKVALLTQSCAVGILVLLAVPGLAQTKAGNGEFWSILVISIASAAFASAGVLDSYSLDALGDEKSRFGEIRMWSGVSWGVSNLAMGYVADVTGGFLVNILFFVASTIVSVIILAVLIPEQRRASPIIASLSSPPPNPSSSIDGRHRLGPWRVKYRRLSSTAFFVELVIFGAAMGLVERLLFVYIVEALGGSYELCGATVVFTVLLEIPIFAKADYLLATLGHDVMFCLGLAAYVPRVVGYTLLTEQTRLYILPIEICHGVTFGLMFTAAVDLSARLAPPGQEAAYQTIQNGLRACFGAGLGAGLGGFFWTKICEDAGRRSNCKRGAVQVFRFAGAAVFIVLCIHLICILVSTYCCNRRVAVSRDVEADGMLVQNPITDPLLPSNDDERRGEIDGGIPPKTRRSRSTSTNSGGGEGASC